MRYRATDRYNQIDEHYPWVILALLCFTACTRDNSTKRTSENDPNPATVASGTAAVDETPSPVTSTAEVASSNPTTPLKPELPRLPPWASDTLQPPAPGSLFARGITGPIQDTFEGILACQVKVSGSDWDAVPPFIGSPAMGLPDIRIRCNGDSVLLPYNSSTGTAIFGGMKLTQDSKFNCELKDVDTFVDDTIAEITLDAGQGFPLKAETSNTTVVCRGIPRSALAVEIKTHEAALERALVAMEKAPMTADLVHPEKSRKAIDPAQKAVLELATYVGYNDPTVRSAIARMTVVETNQAARYVEAINAEIAKHSLEDFQSLPSGRVRCHQTKTNRVEVEVGRRPLEHEWSAKNLGPLQFRFVSKMGIEFTPNFDSLYVNDTKVENLTAKIPAKGKVDVELISVGDRDQPYAIVVREGSKRAYLCLSARR